MAQLPNEERQEAVEAGLSLEEAQEGAVKGGVEKGMNRACAEVSGQEPHG